MKVKLKEGSGILPSYATENSAGVDIHATNKEDIIISAHKSVRIPTGLYMEFPKGYELQIRPRSGLALKHQITVLNTPGTIDADYRNEIGVILINHSDFPYTVKYGDRITQGVFAKVVKAAFIRVNNLSENGRGIGGFGSTGK